MNVKVEEIQDLLLLAARVPVRMQSETLLLQGLALRLLETREEQWVPVALAMKVCPACVWPLIRCEDCADPNEPYCGACDTHWGARDLTEEHATRPHRRSTT